MRAVGKMYIVCALLQNGHTFLFKSANPKYFDIHPPELENYFII